jgi:hypothetical protein
MTSEIEVTERVTVRASQSSRKSYGPGVHEVPDDVADDLLQHRAVERPDQSDQDQNQSGDTGDDADGADSGADSADTDDEGEVPADDETAEFDADDFVDDHHATIRNAVEDGDVDDHLQAVEDAERARDGGPREDSVLQAITDRQEQVQS